MMDRKIIWTDEGKDRNEKIINFPSLTYVIEKDTDVDENNQLLEDIISKLNIEFADGIIGIAQLAILKNVPGCDFHAYIDLGTQLINCFGDILVCDTSTYYIDKNNDFCFDAINGSGRERSCIKFRKWKSSTSEFDKYRFSQNLREGLVTDSDIDKFTESIGSYIKNILGE